MFQCLICLKIQAETHMSRIYEGRIEMRLCWFFLLEHIFLHSTHIPVNTCKFTTHPEDIQGRKNSVILLRNSIFGEMIIFRWIFLSDSLIQE